MLNSLSKYFPAIAAKRLSQVEVQPRSSNQHEFNGIGEFRKILGTEKATFETTYIRLNDDEGKVISSLGTMTWYDARENHPVRSEYRLYYSSNEVIKSSVVGDLVIVGKMTGNKLAVVIAPQGSTSEKQLLWLFGIAEIGNGFTVKDFSHDKLDIGFAGRYILSSIGFEIEETAPDYLEDLINLFGKTFPSTKIFSDFARSTVKDVSPIEEPDKTLMIWLEREELLFKTLESSIVKEKLETGFGKDGKDVDDFIKFSLSVQNRRKARAGFAFENNLALIFKLNGLSYSHGAITERNNKPDFIFPGSIQYHSQDFDVNLLTMLGVKTTAKDRWRQVLSEATKIHHKHLITLEPSISRNQTEDMIANGLQLVIPEPLFTTYSLDQQKQLLTVRGFIEMVYRKQKT
jgi:hypothetical protein